MSQDLKILRLPEVISKTGLSRSNIYQKEATGQFPRHIGLGPRCSGWLEHEIDAWIAERMAESRKAG